MLNAPGQGRAGRSRPGKRAGRSYSSSVTLSPLTGMGRAISGVETGLRRTDMTKRFPRRHTFAPFSASSPRGCDVREAFMIECRTPRSRSRHRLATGTCCAPAGVISTLSPESAIERVRHHDPLMQSQYAPSGQRARGQRAPIARWPSKQRAQLARQVRRALKSAFGMTQTGSG